MKKLCVVFCLFSHTYTIYIADLYKEFYGKLKFKLVGNSICYGFKKKNPD